MKPIDYKQHKKIQKMNLNELNRWFPSIWESGVQAEKEKEEASIKADENIAWYSDEELYEKLLTIPKVGPVLAGRIMDAIMEGKENND